MLMIPMRISETEYIVYVALSPENIERLKTYDPAQFTPAKLGDPWQSLKLKDVFFGYATEEDLEHVNAMAAKDQTVKEVFDFLSRGWKVEPGDHDGPALSMRLGEGEPVN